jgi:hypothetical protein
MVTPRKTPPGGELSIGDKKDNAVISGLRAPVEKDHRSLQVLADLPH